MKRCLDGKLACSLEHWTPEECLGCILANVEDGLFYTIGQLLPEKLTFARALAIRTGIQQVRNALELSNLYMVKQYPAWSERRKKEVAKKRKLVEEQLHNLLNGKDLTYRT